MCPECARAGGAGGGDEVMAPSRFQGRSHTVTAARRAALRQLYLLSTFGTVYTPFLTARKGILVRIYEASA